MLRIKYLFSHLQLLLAFFSVLSMSCTESRKERPSPLRMDSTTIAGSDLKITYSSPGVKGRKIWGGLEPYGKVWRMGANKATVFEASKSVSVAGHHVPEGKYSIFAIPDTTEWTIIFNNHWDQWGAYDYHPEQDLFRMTITPYRLDSLHERLTFKFSDNSLQFRWEYLGFDLPLTLPSSDQSQP